MLLQVGPGPAVKLGTLGVVFVLETRAGSFHSGRRPASQRKEGIGTGNRGELRSG